jgi:hypothetical protein
MAFSKIGGKLFFQFRQTVGILIALPERRVLKFFCWSKISTNKKIF